MGAIRRKLLQSARCRRMMNIVCCGAVILACCFYMLLHWRIFCLNSDSIRHIEYICRMYNERRAAGSLCPELCALRPSAQCHGSSNQVVFETRLTSGRRAIVKTIHQWDSLGPILQPSSAINVPWTWQFTGNNGSRKRRYPTERQFRVMIRDLVATKLNLSLTSNQVKRLARLNEGYVECDAYKRHIEMSDLWPLLHDNEYLSARVYYERDIFPQVLGTCGQYFAMEYTEPVASGSYWSFRTSDTKEDWLNRIRISILILDFLEELELYYPEPSLCDVRLSHFAYAKDGRRLKFLDLNYVYPKSVINHKVSSGNPCIEDSDCDFFDCRSRCDKQKKECNFPVANNNLQIVCEKVFLGWNGNVIVPGLLVTRQAPAGLTVLLRRCADPVNEGTKARHPADEELKKSLYTALTEIESDMTADEDYV